MHMKIPGNPNFIIFPNGEIRNAKGALSGLKESDGKVEISLFGKQMQVCKKWLALIAHYEFSIGDRLLDVVFKDINPLITNSNIDKTMVFTRPILFKTGYRVIPNYPRYAISNHGLVIDTEMSSDVRIDRHGDYPTVFIYSPDKRRYNRVLVHRLVALAWIKNDDYLENPIVNHIDGNKENHRSSNLEWCSYSHNSFHAYENDLRSKPVEKYKTRDIETGEIVIHDSIKKLCEYFELDPNNPPVARDKKTRHNLIKHKYQLKKLDDNTPWAEVDDPLMRKNKYTIELVFPDGKREEYKDIVSVMRRLKIWNISYNISEIKRVAAGKYPGLIINVTENVVVKKVEAKNVLTGEITKADTISALARILGINKSTIVAALTRTRMYVCKGYIFRHQTEDPWPTEIYRHTNGLEAIEAVNEKTGEKLLFSSIKEFCKLFNVSYYITKSRLNDGLPIVGWRIYEKRNNT